MSELTDSLLGTAASWASENPTLEDGAIGVETDTSKWKIGDGATAWASLGYGPGAFTNYATCRAVSAVTAASGLSEAQVVALIEANTYTQGEIDAMVAATSGATVSPTVAGGI